MSADADGMRRIEQCLKSLDKHCENLTAEGYDGVMITAAVSLQYAAQIAAFCLETSKSQTQAIDAAGRFIDQIRGKVIDLIFEGADKT